ncbi:DUF317 domain-containing protein [Streptomyces sp. PTY087I2]|uniref:DUF317 domain-containing protein n=1 Tax=Streptomyces sp. PTY087I2 TaxID=1819298 RepID=UPI00080B9443|nr:DUF317 domain-containing protein [Streptomyces sp. PTY087I2]OCC11525.1 hypothetical protein A3Q37_02722 [Streptomyces sp. PTY087I2]
MSTQKTHTQDPYQEVLVSPRYLAGSDWSGEAGFAPVSHWPHHRLDDDDCQLLVTSPDMRIRIGWFGDYFEPWQISASEDPVSGHRWTASFSSHMPPEIVAGLTAALARDHARVEPGSDQRRFLATPSIYWADKVQPLINAGWTRDGGAERGTVEFVAPDGQAGVLIDNRLSGRDDETVTLWAGPPGYGTRAKAVFTARTPSHLVAATAAVMADPTPVVRERQSISPRVEHLVTLTPVASAPEPETARAPTPLDVRRTAVTQAVQRAARAPRTAADLRVMAAQSRSAGAMQERPGSFSPAAAVRSPVGSSGRRHGR